MSWDSVCKGTLRSDNMGVLCAMITKIRMGKAKTCTEIPYIMAGLQLYSYCHLLSMSAQKQLLALAIIQRLETQSPEQKDLLVHCYINCKNFSVQ